jgi:hypothetical protein
MRYGVAGVRGVVAQCNTTRNVQEIEREGKGPTIFGIAFYRLWSPKKKVYVHYALMM